MLFFRIKGRLGNQMFIYAFARALQVKYPGVEICFDQYGDLKNNFVLDKSDSAPAHYARKFRFKYFGRPRADHRVEDFNDCRMYYPAADFARLSNKTIDGYFQSETYFDFCRGKVLDWFRPKAEHVTRFKNDTSDYFDGKRTIAVHLRRTDYISGGFPYDFLKGPDLSLPHSYYREALAAAGAQHADRIYFLSDDIESVRKEFSDYPNAFFSTYSAMTDLQIMMHCDSVIIANSTFSWWGAWLNAKKDKRIYTPEHFLGFKAGFEFPEKITPASWIKIKP